MRDKKEFHSLLEAIDGRPFKEYGRIVGDFDFSRYVLKFHMIPEDPDTVLFVARVPQVVAGFPPHSYNSPVRRTGLEDLLTRAVAEQIQDLKTGLVFGNPRRSLSISGPGQKILPRSSMVVTDEYVEARIYVDLPHNRGRVDSSEASTIFFEDVPWVVSQALIYCNLEEREVERFVDVMEDADQVRQLLITQGLVSFVGEGANLKRLADTDLPASTKPAQPIVIDPNLMKEVDVPNAGTLKGLGVPTGLTLVVGDVASGRSDLLRAMADGIYNHIPDDGREFVITAPDAVYVAADPGRTVRRVDLSGFLTTEGGDVARFTTDNADGVHSQAAGVVEALEVGARALLLDEEDSSPEFLSGNAVVSQMLSGAQPAVTSLAARARELVDDMGVSLVVGAWALANDFMPLADTIYYIEKGVVRDITDAVKESEWPQLPVPEPVLGDIVEKSRWVVATSIDPSLGVEDVVISAPGVEELEFGRHWVDLSRVPQLADRFQTGTIGLILQYAKMHYIDEGRPLRELLDLVDRDLSTEGLETLARELRGDLVRPRRYEIAAALNRLESLRISQQG